MPRGLNSHPSSHGRLILRSLVDASTKPAPQADARQEIAASLAANADFSAPVLPAPVAQATNHRVHPGGQAPAPLGPSPLRPETPRTEPLRTEAPRADIPRQPGVTPHPAHPGEGDRSVKAPRMPAAPLQRGESRRSR